MVVLSLPALELAVARTLTFSFLGFLVSLLPLFFSLDMGVSFGEEDRRGGCRGGGHAVCFTFARQRVFPSDVKAKLVMGAAQVLASGGPPLSGLLSAALLFSNFQVGGIGQ